MRIFRRKKPAPAAESRANEPKIGRRRFLRIGVETAVLTGSGIVAARYGPGAVKRAVPVVKKVGGEIKKALGPEPEMPTAEQMRREYLEGLEKERREREVREGIEQIKRERTAYVKKRQPEIFKKMWQKELEKLRNTVKSTFRDRKAEPTREQVDELRKRTEHDAMVEAEIEADRKYYGN